MQTCLTRSSLTLNQQRLVALLQRIRFGRIHRLRVRGGEPDWGHDVTACSTYKVLGDNGPHPAHDADDYTLRREIVTFLQLLQQIGDGDLLNLEVRNGLPFTFEREETFTPDDAI
jgi:hypothetical protein